MKIAFDHQIFTLQCYGGISRYVVRLAEALNSMGEEIQIDSLLHQNHYLFESPVLRENRIHLDKFPKGLGRAASHINSLYARYSHNKSKPDIIHETFFSSQDARKKRFPTVLTVYDMIHERYPESFPENDPTAKSKLNAVKRADSIICISESTRRDLLEYIDVDEAKVSVVYLGFDKQPVDKTQLTNRAQMANNKPILLYVGSRAGYKNFSGLVRAMASSARLKNTFQLVAFGGGPFTAAEQRFFNDLGFRSDSISQTGGTDEVLNDYYQKATAFVFPSIYEGFGLPPLEAMAQGCPVISSNSSSMPEVIGDAGVYFDPLAIEDITQVLEKTLFAEAGLASLSKKGQKRIHDFSWHKCASQSLAQYQILAGK